MGSRWLDATHVNANDLQNGRRHIWCHCSRFPVVSRLKRACQKVCTFLSGLFCSSTDMSGRRPSSHAAVCFPVVRIITDGKKKQRSNALKCCQMVSPSSSSVTKLFFYTFSRITPRPPPAPSSPTHRNPPTPPPLF